MQWLRIQHFKLHPTASMSYIKVFDHLQLLCMGIWLHTHTLITTDISQISESWLILVQVM